MRRSIKTKEQIHKYAVNNDGECVVGLKSYHDKSRTHVFKDPTSAKKAGVYTWGYYFTDESECFDSEKFLGG